MVPGILDSTCHRRELVWASRADLAPLPHSSPLTLDAFSQITLLGGEVVAGNRGGNDLEARTHNGPVTVWSPARERKEICPVFLPWAGMLIQDGEMGGGGEREEKEGESG